MQKIVSKLFRVTAPVTAWVLAVPSVLAIGPTTPGVDPTGITGEGQAKSGFTIDRLINLIETLASWFLIIIGLIGVIFLLYGALVYITAGGDSEKVDKAKKTIIYALIGIAVAILAFAIVTFVASLLR